MRGTPARYMARVMKSKSLSIVQVAERAKRKGHKLSAGYVNNVLYGVVDNPTVNLLKAIAAGLGRPEAEVFRAFGVKITA